MQKWEYMFVEQEGGTEGGTLYRVNGQLVEHKEVWTFANEMGEEGWEMIGAIVLLKINRYMMIFKRQKR